MKSSLSLAKEHDDLSNILGEAAFRIKELSDYLQVVKESNEYLRVSLKSTRADFRTDMSKGKGKGKGKGGKGKGKGC